MIRGSYSTMVLIGAFLFYQEPPTLRQAVGGIITMAGVMVLVFEKSRITRQEKARQQAQATARAA
jgi:drug/metabolite transporter (DMT)-like permease